MNTKPVDQILEYYNGHVIGFDQEYFRISLLSSSSIRSEASLPKALIPKEELEYLTQDVPIHIDVYFSGRTKMRFSRPHEWNNKNALFPIIRKYETDNRDS